MSLTRPTYSGLSSDDFTLRAVAAMSDTDMDGPQISVQVPGYMADVLTDQDIDSIAAVLSSRLAAAYPTYYVAVEKLWTDRRSAATKTMTHTP
ncbi:hypothetical protein ACFC5Z_23550 [Streptomyces sp. NPDC056004]|uniref:hypothetical protein n=1 Tax=Streptomyces sp. NPDC056004 TaxID=3345677 RepID=UPI0035DF680F